MEEKFKSGFVSIIGKSNVGKSTLLNAITGYKISIVSDRPQTTRFNVRGVLNEKDVAQIVFLDTPGILKPHNELGKLMMQDVKEAVFNMDIILYVASAKDLLDNDAETNLNFVQNLFDIPLFLVINKIDKVTNEELLLIIDKYKDFKVIKEIIPVCAKTKYNVDELKKTIIEYLPEGKEYYDDDFIDDLTEDLYISEIIREKAINLTYREVPYAIAVKVIEKYKNEKNIFFIHAVLYVEKDSQKGILIGKKARLIKKIGTYARQELEETLEEKIFLDLRVQTKKNWRKNIYFMKSINEK